MITLWHLLSFNSKLVRLEVQHGQVWQKCLLRFNSKLVRLEEHWWGVSLSIYHRFNSKLVRLEERIAKLTETQLKEFQFQIGAIRSDS